MRDDGPAGRAPVEAVAAGVGLGVGDSGGGAPERRQDRRRARGVMENGEHLAEGKRVLIDDPARFDGVRVIGVDEDLWRHTRRGDKHVTVIIDLTWSCIDSLRGAAGGRSGGGRSSSSDIGRHSPGRPVPRRLELSSVAPRTSSIVATDEGYAGWDRRAIRDHPRYG